MLQLTENAIPKMLKVQQGKNESYIVDVVKLRKKKDSYKSFIISDGKATCKCVVDASQPRKDIQALMKKNNNQPLRINITAHIAVSDNQQTGIEIISFQVVKPKLVQTKLQFSFKSKPPSFIKRQEVQKRGPSHALQKLSLKQQKHDQQTQQNSDINIKGFELISDLYETFYSWVLLTRVIDAKYEQFTSKAGNLTKMLSLQLIDRCEYVITGKFFGDIAVNRQNMIEKGKIYRVSRGKIVVDKYVTQAYKKGSKYSILFNKDSQFVEVIDIPQFPIACTNWLRLSEISQLPTGDNVYNFVGVLIELNEEVTVQKQSKSFVFQHFKIADPISDLVYRCTIWNRSFKVGKELIGKSILIKNCKVSSYKGETTLSTTMRSYISSHPFFARFNDKLQHFQVLQQETRVSTIQQILADIPQDQRMAVKTVEVWIAEICFNQKWSYESCPKCKKTGSSNTTCTGCSLLITDPIKRFKIPIELSDYTGAIRVISFQQSATVLLNYVQIHELLNMDETELTEFGNTLCFQQYRMQIATKKDEVGRINHSIVGKPIPVDLANSTARNFQEIRQITTRIRLSH